MGTQVNIPSCILGSGGRAKEAQAEFLVLVEHVIKQPDLAKSVLCYQLAVDEAKVRLNFAVSGCLADAGADGSLGSTTR